MYIQDEVLASQNQFDKFYAYCRRIGGEWPRKAEFLQMARVLNPKLGRYARDFFPAWLRGDERATHLYSVMDRRSFSMGTLLTLHGLAALGQLGAHSFDLAYIELLREVDVLLWANFVNSSEGRSIKAGYGTADEEQGLRLKLDAARHDHADALAAVRNDPDPGTQPGTPIAPYARPDGFQKIADQTGQAIRPATELTPNTAELLLRQHTDAQLQNMAAVGIANSLGAQLAGTHAPLAVAKEQVPPLAAAVAKMPVAALARQTANPAAAAARVAPPPLIRRGGIMQAPPSALAPATPSNPYLALMATASRKTPANLVAPLNGTFQRSAAATAFKKQGKCVPKVIKSPAASKPAKRVPHVTVAAGPRWR